MWINATAGRIYDSFVQPERLTRFWLASASGPLEISKAVDWDFMVAGARDKATAFRLDPGTLIEWTWSDGAVRIELEPMDAGTAVTLVNDGFPGDADKQVEAALNRTEGFTIVLCDLKTLLETGKSAGLTKSKARLIEARG
jgi:uncharacterized protein YndB with AHSA1/START domain